MANKTLHFVEQQDLEPIAYADRFVDPDPTKAQPPDELLRRARMILATELGKDPLLRQEMRNRFRNEALISVHPTERGIAKIDEHHPYYASTLSARSPRRSPFSFIEL